MSDYVWDKKKTCQFIELIESSPTLWNCLLKEYRERKLEAKYKVS